MTLGCAPSTVLAPTHASIHATRKSPVFGKRWAGRCECAQQSHYASHTRESIARDW